MSSRTRWVAFARTLLEDRIHGKKWSSRLGFEYKSKTLKEESVDYILTLCRERDGFWSRPSQGSIKFIFREILK